MVRHGRGFQINIPLVVFAIGILFFGAIFWKLGTDYGAPFVADILQDAGIIDERQDVGYNPDITGDVPVNYPLSFSVIDKYQGAAVGSAQVEIYSLDGIRLETMTTTASGVATTVQAYESGTQLYIKVSKGSALKWYQFTVPTMKEEVAQSVSVNGPHTLMFFTLGTYTVQVMDGDGNVYTNNSFLDKNVLGKNVITLTITVYETVDNRGYESSYDPINNVQLKAVGYFKVTGTGYDSIILSGIQDRIERGIATVHYGVEIPDSALTKWKIGNDYRDPYRGVWSITITLDLTAYTGNLADLVFTLMLYSDWNHFVQRGTFGPSSMKAITFVLNLQG